MNSPAAACAGSGAAALDGNAGRNLAKGAAEDSLHCSKTGLSNRRQDNIIETLSHGVQKVFCAWPDQRRQPALIPSRISG